MLGFHVPVLICRMILSRNRCECSVLLISLSWKHLVSRKETCDLSNERAIIMRFLAQLEISMCILLQFMAASNGFFGLTSPRREFDDLIVPNLLKEFSSFNPATGDYQGSNQIVSADSCRSLYLHRKQRSLCQRDVGFSDTLKAAILTAVSGCQKELKYERWNCSLGKTRRLLLKKRYKETAFLNAINAASLIHTISRACSRGQLTSSCSCQLSYNELSNKPFRIPGGDTWRWSGCGDNTDAAETIIRDFTNMNSHSPNSRPNSIDQHNFRVGLKVVKDKRTSICKCHGVSGSCTMRSCWSAVQPMARTTKAIRKKYLSAKKIVFPKKQQNHTFSRNSSSAYPTVQSNTLNMTRKSTFNNIFPVGQLVYRSNSPSYCTTKSSWFGGITGRPCRLSPPTGLEFLGSRVLKRSSCSVLCCQQGYHAVMEAKPELCNCTMNHLVVNCDHCFKKVLKYYCN